MEGLILRAAANLVISGITEEDIIQELTAFGVSEEDAYLAVAAGKILAADRESENLNSSDNLTGRARGSVGEPRVPRLD